MKASGFNYSFPILFLLSGIFLALPAQASVPANRTFYNVALSVKMYEDASGGFLASSLPSFFGSQPITVPIGTFSHNATFVVAPTITDSSTPNGTNAREFGLYTGAYQSMPGIINEADSGLLRFFTNMKLGSDLGVRDLPTATGQSYTQPLSFDMALVRVNEATNTVAIDVDPGRGLNYTNSFTRNQSSYTTHLGANAIAEGGMLVKFSPDGSQVQGELIFKSGSAYSAEVTYTATFAGSTTTSLPPTPQEGQSGIVWGQVYNDLDNDQEKDTNEPPLANRRVYLDANDNALFDAGEKNFITNEAGFYLLSDLATGFYRLRLESTSGWQTTTGSLIVSVTSGQVTGSQNFGSRRPGLSVSGVVVVDLNADGLRDDDLDDDGDVDWNQDTQGGLFDWTVFVDADGDRILDANEVRTQSDVQGKFYIHLGNITAGEYAVCLVTKPGWVLSAPNAGAHNGVHGPLNLTPGDTNISAIYFRAYQPATISGTTFNDLNADSEKDPGESGLAGWHVYLDADKDKTFDAGEPSVLTGADGSYALTGIKPGSYEVRQVQQEDWIRSTPSVAVPGFGDPQGGYGVRLFSGGHVLPADFGNHQEGAIIFTTFHDKNGDGIKTEEEPYLPGRTVFIDSDNDGVLDKSTATITSSDIPKTLPDSSTTTSSLSVTGRPGVLRDVNVTLNISHPVAHDLEITLIAPTGKRIPLALRPGNTGANFNGTVFDDEATNSIAEGAAPFSGNFKPQKALASLKGINPNGTWQIEITDSQQDHSGTLNSWSLTIESGEASAQTDNSGFSYFPGLSPGTYNLRQIVPDGWVETMPLTGFLTADIAPGDVDLLNFGSAKPTTVRGYVWDDVNGDGYWNSNEAGLAGVRVYIDTNFNEKFDSGEASVLSGEDGAYAIINLKPGSHYVRSVPQVGRHVSWPSNGRYQAILQSEETSYYVDFGHTAKASISGLVYDDADGSGFPNGSEALLPNRTVYIDENNNGRHDASKQEFSADVSQPIPFYDAPTDTGGLYSSLSVSGVTNPVRLELKLNIAQTDNQDLVAYVRTPAGRWIYLFGGVGAFSADFNNTILSSHAVKPIEAGDGPFEGGFRPVEPLVLQPGESPNGTWQFFVGNVRENAGTLQDWQLTFYSGEPSRTSDAGGLYAFDGLAPGNYIVRDVLPDGWSRITPNAGFHARTLAAGDSATCSFGQARTKASIADAVANEGNSTTPGSITFNVTLNGPASQEVSVFCGAYNGTARWDQDFARTSSSVKFSPGEVSKPFTVALIGDSIIEADETFSVILSNAANPQAVQLADGQAIGTIRNDDFPVVSINDITITEGNTGTTNAVFNVTLAQPGFQPVSVNYSTANGTAFAPGDYTAKSGTLIIAAGQTSGTISVPITGDALDEPNETFQITLSNAFNATLVDANAVATITDNDATPTLAINDVTITEGNVDKNATFTVTLSAPSGQTVIVNAIPSNGTARSPGDYTSAGARLSFAPGEKSKTFSVPIKGDLVDEANEVFYVILSSPANAAIARGRGVGTITDDDAPPSITIDNINIGEGNSGQRVAALRLKLSAPSGQGVRVTYATANGTATGGNDYVAVAPTIVTFNVGSLYAYARVLLNGDLLNEKDETFLVTLSSSQNATIADSQAIGMILNDDSVPGLSINDVSIAEGNSGTKNLTFTVTLSKASGQAVSVNYATADGTAKSTSDYASRTGTLTFAPGSALTRTITVPITGDVAVEANEAFYVFLSGQTNASISKARGIGTITNDDAS